MRADEQRQVAHEHGSAELVASSSPDQSHRIRVVFDLWILDGDLADDVAGVDGYQTDSDGQDDSCDHPEVCKCGRDAKSSQSDCLDDEADCEFLPSELVELLFAFHEGFMACQVDLFVLVGGVVLSLWARCFDLLVRV